MNESRHDPRANPDLPAEQGPAASEPVAMPEAPADPTTPAAGPEPVTMPEAAPERPEVAAAPEPPPAPRPARRSGIEPEELPVTVPRTRLAAMSRRDFLLFGAGVLATAAGAWWWLPDSTRARLLPGGHDRLDTLAARVGLTSARRERLLDRALTLDDDVAEALYARDRRVRTYARSEVTPLRNNYDGQTPGPGYLAGWTLTLGGLASGAPRVVTLAELLRLPHHEQVTRLVCVEGWSAIAWWGGLRFADLLAAYPPASGARWAALCSSINLDLRGRPDPYYVSIDLDTARHPQTLLATHQDGRALTLAYGAPLRLLAPMKLGLKNIKAVTDIVYTAQQPADYWNERGYSRYDGL